MDHSKNAKLIFNKYAESYQEKYMDVSLYAEVLDLFLELIQKKNAEVLDIGCGPGNIIKYLLDKKPGLKITGIDISENMLHLAQVNNPNAKFKLMDCRRLEKLDQKFDAVICSFSLPYLSKKEAFNLIKDIAHLLRKESIAYISTMEGSYERSGLVGSSEGSKEQLQTFYHESDYLLGFCIENDLKVLQSVEVENESNQPGVKDLILIVRK